MDNELRGRELDRAIAEARGLRSRWPYSTEIALAWTLFEEMAISTGWDRILAKDALYEQSALITSDEVETSILNLTPEAICRAWLQWYAARGEGE